MRILFFGDIVGALGRQGVVQILPDLRKEYSPDLVIANIENLAHGAGFTAKTLQELSDAGVDAFTGGNHSWDNPLGVPLFDEASWKGRLIAPINYGGAKGGQNHMILLVGDERVLVVNLMGQLFTHDKTSSPFTAFEETLKAIPEPRPKVILVDLHAEATSEKEAFGHFVDGRVSAVLGTHTHVPTADEKILPQGTAYLTDVGRCGAYDSVLGFDKKTVLDRFLRLTEIRYEIPKSGATEVNAALIEIDSSTGRAISLDRIRRIVDVPAKNS